jgi:uncharacterized protein
MRTLKSALVISILSLISFNLWAQISLESSLLWKLSGNGIESPSYLYGTIHAICPDDLVLDQRVKSAFSETKKLVLEIKMDDPNLMNQMQMGMLIKDGKSIKTYLNEDEYKEVGLFLKDSMGLDLSVFGIIQPLFLTSMLIPRYLGCMPASVEGKLMEWAAPRDMEISGLESIDDQLNVFNEIGLENQSRMLLETVRNFDKGRQELKTMIANYKKEEINALFDLIRSSEYQNFEEALLSKRNNNWIPVIEKMAKEESAFFAFGAGHLGGEQGVVNLLRKAGFTVEAVSTSGN